MILLSEMHIMSEFRFKPESRSFSWLIWRLSEEGLRVIQPSLVLWHLLKKFRFTDWVKFTEKILNGKLLFFVRCGLLDWTSPSIIWLLLICRYNSLMTNGDDRGIESWYLSYKFQVHTMSRTWNKMVGVQSWIKLIWQKLIFREVLKL